MTMDTYIFCELPGAALPYILGLIFGCELRTLMANLARLISIDWCTWRCNHTLFQALADQC
jgi:hypothetical protein